MYHVHEHHTRKSIVPLDWIQVLLKLSHTSIVSSGGPIEQQRSRTNGDDELSF